MSNIRLLTVFITYILLCNHSSGQNNTPQLHTNSIDEVISAMSPEEKVYMVIGNNNNVWRKVQGVGSTWQCERLGITPAILDDGPAGLRMPPQRDGDSHTYYCTAFPTATALAATWNTELVKEVGLAIGNEVLEYGSDVLLAPAVNIQRNPMCGRNFEYYSEDPYLSGYIGSAMVKGVQANGVGATVKHFAANNQETNRKDINEVISQRALRELYLKAFEIIVKEASPWSIMSSYNRINGFYTSENKDLLTTILRNEWNYQGIVMTDWVSGDDAVAQMRAGNDLINPGFPAEYAYYHYNELLSALKDKTLDEDILNRNIHRILSFIKKTPRFNGYIFSSTPNLKAHTQIARNTANEAMVLLKNKQETLPLKKTRSIALFGKTSYELITGGTGSGEVNYKHAVSLKEGLKKNKYNLSQSVENLYLTYLDSIRHTDSKNKYVTMNSAEKIITKQFIQKEVSQSDIAIITIGRISGEGEDRNPENYFSLSEIETQLIKNVCDAYHAANKKVIVILNIGGVIETASWKDYPDAILLAWQAGQQGGNAIVDILSGKVTPSGKLPVSFPIAYSDVPSSSFFPGIPKKDPINSFYNEGIYVGYRYYETFNIPTSYEFGYGLSYTNFEYSNIQLDTDTIGNIKVCVTLKNIGRKTGKEIVQLYISAPTTEIDKPLYELKAFAKTTLLKPQESQIVSFLLSAKDLASFQSGISSWVADKGEYILSIGASVKDIRQKVSFHLPSSILVEKVHDVLYPNFSIKDMNSASRKVLKEIPPKRPTKRIPHDFLWHW
ncbi:beta-glucosidase [Bacteroides cellulosilyticus]|uniref:beta-glucosidase n=1 Tax=Bacteroides cellulosilyticus TaxID=246787 RepID=UPI0018A0EE3F|nr:glycoside hydrolase family 3 C-terminal domain-containing protein [Bacteroides cellulosilyticus]